MIRDYEVFEPDNERLAQIIERILKEKGYDAIYQIGYPNNKIFITLDSKVEADRISVIIRRFMEKISLTDRETTTDKLTPLISNLGSSLSAITTEIKPEIPTEKVEKKIEKKDIDNSKILESETHYTPKLEE